MAIDKVSSSAVELVVGVADRCEVPLTELCAGLSIDERKLRRRLGGLEWDLFVELIARLEARLGFTRLDVSIAHLPDISPKSQRMLSSFASGPALMRFVCKLMGPAMYPMLITSYSEKANADGSATGHLTMRLRDGFRGCETFFKLCRTALSVNPTVVGDPPIPVRCETSARAADFWLELPRTESLFGRLKRRVAGSDWKETIAELEEEKQRLLDAHAELWRRRDSEFGGKLDSAARRWTLTDRQLQVLSGLARGRSNKELANELGCSMKTVETHVTELLRRSHQDSRLSLVATFWRDV